MQNQTLQDEAIKRLEKEVESNGWSVLNEPTVEDSSAYMTICNDKATDITVTVYESNGEVTLDMKLNIHSAGNSSQQLNDLNELLSFVQKLQNKICDR
jgi:hypothetical protein